MKKYCAWCEDKLSLPEKHAAAGNVTHGICSRCALEVTSGVPRTAGEILDLIAEPVFLIDDNGVVQGANRAAAEMLSKELPGIKGRLGGDAFECSYARQPEGCGRTVHCKTCAIRNIVMDTLHRGHGFDKVPAFQSIDTEDGSVTMRFVITTEKVGEQVLLRIDSSRKGFSA